MEILTGVKEYSSIEGQEHRRARLLLQPSFLQSRRSGQSKEPAAPTPCPRPNGINLKAELSGTDVLHKLREMRAYATTPAIASTAYAMPGDRERFLDAGFDGYVSKPFLKRHLLETIEQFMSAGTGKDTTAEATA